MITGIYKITSPTKKIYIGQAIDIEKRWIYYKKLDCKGQRRLYNSLKKYGIDKHKFEVICQCSIDELNEMERYYQDAFCVLNKNGLNCTLTKTTDRKNECSLETRKKISDALKKRSPELKAEIHKKLRNPSQETRKKMSNSGKNKSIEVRKKLSELGSKIVLHLETGVFFDSAKDAASCFNYKAVTFCGMLNGKRKNKTNCIYI